MTFFDIPDDVRVAPQQSFSADGGVTWETNRIMNFRRSAEQGRSRTRVQ
jgi:hypothetical protein